MDGSFPLGLQFSEHFFAQVAAFAPALGELVQLTGNAFPVWSLGVFCSPGFEFFDQSQALGFVSCGLRAGFFEPSVHHHMGLVASRIKSLPQSGIGRSLFVDFFPFFTQIAQCLLHLAATHGWHVWWWRVSWGFLRNLTRQLISYSANHFFSCPARHFLSFVNSFIF